MHVLFNIRCYKFFFFVSSFWVFNETILYFFHHKEKTRKTTEKNIENVETHVLACVQCNFYLLNLVILALVLSFVSTISVRREKRETCIKFFVFFCSFIFFYRPSALRLFLDMCVYKLIAWCVRNTNTNTNTRALFTSGALPFFICGSNGQKVVRMWM